MSASTLPPLPSLVGERFLKSEEPLPPFCWCDGLLCTPWERTGKRQRLTVEQDVVVGVVAAAALGLHQIDGNERNSALVVWWISAAGALLGATEVSADWWRSRQARYVTLEIERAMP